jgi:lysophospholipid acyltransferase (LPLAT)-like uncharacterized protein
MTAPRYGDGVSLAKKLLGGSLVTAVVRAFIQPYRALMFAGFLLDLDPRLVALMRSREPVVFLMWHQDFVHTIGYLSQFRRRRPMVVLASASRDGGIAAAAADGAGFRHIARGSSAKGGAGGLLQLSRLSRDARRFSVVVVADGPRPPARDLKPGGLLIARDAGLPIWLVRTSWHPDHSLRSTWARFHVPRPWSRGVVLADGPIAIPAETTRDGLDAFRLDIESRLNALASRADDAAQARWGG